MKPAFVRKRNPKNLRPESICSTFMFKKKRPFFFLKLKALKLIISYKIRLYLKPHLFLIKQSRPFAVLETVTPCFLLLPFFSEDSRWTFMIFDFEFKNEMLKNVFIVSIYNFQTFLLRYGNVHELTDEHTPFFPRLHLLIHKKSN